MAKQEPLNNVGGNAKYYNHYGKLFGDYSKK
jgi:hypothetical protein